jgi:hypothetical protein
MEGMAANDYLKEAGIIIALNVGARTWKSMPLLTIVDKRSLFAVSPGVLWGR